MCRVAFPIAEPGKRKLWRCKSGASASEMSLILPLLTTMIFAVFEYGCVIYSYSAMQFGANRVARTVSVNRMTNAEAEVAALDLLPAWVRDNVSISVSQSAPVDPNSNLVRVQMSVAADDATPISILTRVVPWQLNTNVEMKQELPYVD